MTAIKICGLTRLEDARWASVCGADLLGFVFVPASPRYIPPSCASAIREALREEGCRARFVGVFVDEPRESLRRIIETCALDFAQLHGHESPEYARQVGTPAIIARRVKDRVPWEDLTAYDAWAYLLDAYHPDAPGGTGRSWDYGLLQGKSKGLPRVIVAGGLTAANVHTAIRETRPWGVDVSSGVEERPGHKDARKVERFIQRVREEDAA